MTPGLSDTVVPAGNTLISPLPLRSVPIVHVQMTIATRDKGIDAPIQVGKDPGTIRCRCARGNTLIIPCPPRAIPVVQKQATIGTRDKGINGLCQVGKD